MGQSRKPAVFGAPYSVYVRSVRLTLEEKTVDYDLVPVDIFAAGGPTREQVARHPFGKIPAFEHDGFRLYEAGAIARYIDEAFAPVPLTARPKPRGPASAGLAIAMAAALPQPAKPSAGWRRFWLVPPTVFLGLPLRHAIAAARATAPDLRTGLGSAAH